MSVKGFFKSVLNSGEQEEETRTTGATSTTTSLSGSATAGVNNFLSGTSKFLDSVQTKKNGLISDLSNKLTSFKMPGEQSTNESEKKKKSNSNDDDDSSASEYGDDGDRPMYAEVAPVERQVSVESIDSLPDEDAERRKSEIRALVSNLLQQSLIEEKMVKNFRDFIVRHSGRSRFAKELKLQTKGMKCISNQLLEQLALFIGPLLNQCNENEDYAPGYIIMHLSFSLYHETVSSNGTAEQIYLYVLLKDQVIWQSMRFWNAAFFIALQRERAERQRYPVIEGDDPIQAETDFQNDIVYSQLSKFLWRMYTLGMSHELCMDFIRKQANATNLPNDLVKIIQKNCQHFFETTNSNEVSQ
ncbi:unnamed protein product [Schistosoma rodhaini]|uniref:SBF1/SBF2 domain-containing protein n=1 Tax=Schistosoma rodhaini TaxID=6188 RepID=A0AA85G901_9TREM|nr:unnamed protein product [Schistosoma rodhaini]